MSGWVGARAGESFVYITTRGRRTGQAHTIEIWFGADPPRWPSLYLLSGGGRASDWVRNLLANPEVSVRLAGDSRPGRARLITDPEEDAHVRRVLAAKYQGWHEPMPLSEWAATALAVAIDVEAEPSSGVASVL